LHQACKEARGPEELGRLYWFLKRYVRKHFKDEETLQQTLGYHDYPCHKAAHESFIRELRYLEIKYAQDGGSSTVIVKSLRMMSDWLRNHINQLDMELASFVREMTSLEYTEAD
jgi:hemerythrin